VDLNELTQRLVAANLNLSDVELRSPRELRVSVPRESLTGFADYLRAEVHARPELIVAEDTRSEAKVFTLRYIFEVDGAAGFVVASVRVPAEQPTFPSLATRWYLASRFEREIHDLFGLLPSAHPDLRRLPLHQFWAAIQSRISLTSLAPTSNDAFITPKDAPVPGLSTTMTA